MPSPLTADRCCCTCWSCSPSPARHDQRGQAARHRRLGGERPSTKLYDAGEQLVSVDIGPGLSARGFACAGSSYVGVGVTADPRHRGASSSSATTRPHPRAGLQHDDVVLEPEVWRDAHQEGVILHVTILRQEREDDRASAGGQDLHRVARTNDQSQPPGSVTSNGHVSNTSSATRIRVEVASEGVDGLRQGAAAALRSPARCDW